MTIREVLRNKDFGGFERFQEIMETEIVPEKVIDLIILKIDEHIKTLSESDKIDVYENMKKEIIEITEENKKTFLEN